MGFKALPTLISLFITLLIWFVIPVPSGVDPDAWHLLAMFVGVIAAIIGKSDANWCHCHYCNNFSRYYWRD